MACYFNSDHHFKFHSNKSKECRPACDQEIYHDIEKKEILTSNDVLSSKIDAFNSRPCEARSKLDSKKVSSTNNIPQLVQTSNQNDLNKSHNVSITKMVLSEPINVSYNQCVSAELDFFKLDYKSFRFLFN